MDQESDRLLSVAGAIVEGSGCFLGRRSSVSHRRRERRDTARSSGPRDDPRGSASYRAGSTTPPPNETQPLQLRVAAPSRWRHLVILDKIGEGSFGTVYRAYDSQLAVDVALKLLSPLAHGAIEESGPRS